MLKKTSVGDHQHPQFNDQPVSPQRRKYMKNGIDEDRDDSATTAALKLVISVDWELHRVKDHHKPTPSQLTGAKKWEAFDRCTSSGQKIAKSRASTFLPLTFCLPLGDILRRSHLVHGGAGPSSLWELGSGKKGDFIFLRLSSDQDHLKFFKNITVF